MTKFGVQKVAQVNTQNLTLNYLKGQGYIIVEVVL